MRRLCARPACSAPAAATFNFDGLNRIVWLNDLEQSPAFSAGDLCRRHAEELRPPRNWELRDRRPTRVARPAASAPSRHLAPATRPNGGPPRRREAAVGAVAAAEPPPRVDVPPSTPLLARAFRGVGGA
jgi:hypothetical protein